MPELPDVQIFKQYLDATSLHREIEKVAVHSHQILKGISGKKLKTKLEGHRFESTRRHGKYLFVRLDNNSWLVFHFGMTGFLKYFRAMDKEPAHDRLLIGFSNGYHLAYDSQRKLGEINITADIDGFIKKKKAGPDPLDPSFDFAVFKKALARTRARVKSALMNQQLLAGIGNIYSDEILFQAGVNPNTKVDQLNTETLKKLFNAIKSVLQTAVKFRAKPEEFPDSYLLHYRHSDGKCPECDGQIKHFKISGRTAYYCPTCQK